MFVGICALQTKQSWKDGAGVFVLPRFCSTSALAHSSLTTELGVAFVLNQKKNVKLSAAVAAL